MIFAEIFCRDDYCSVFDKENVPSVIDTIVKTIVFVPDSTQAL